MPVRDDRGHRRVGAQRVARVSLARRRALSALLLPAALLPLSARALPARVASARIWPASEYTRLILEGPVAIGHRMIALRDPPRVVLDLEAVELSAELQRLPSLVAASDPYIARIRLGRQPQEVLRVVLDLREEVKTELFALAPVAAFGHRVVLDLYPLAPIDPLMALLQEGRGEAPGPVPAEPARGDSGAQEAKPGPARRRRITIALDPGHGGEDPGAIGPRGTQEKHVVLAIARKMKTMLDAEPGMRTMLTRDDDYYVPLAARVEKARRVQADLLVSIHADAFTVATARGSSVFALSERGATSAAAKWLAQRENAADLIGGVNLDVGDPVLARTLLDLSQRAQIADSLKAGRHVLGGIGSINPLHKREVEQAGFAVLKAPDIPSILVETAFISNPDEELRLRSDRHQARFAESMCDGIKGYFAGNPPLARG
jgi:N-acetylmuramoyl-L-alanine amidase